MSIYKSLKVYDPSPSRRLESDRTSYLANLTIGKRVLHVGCSDWPITEERLSNRCLLHSRIIESASYVVGIDLSEEGIRIMQKNGIADVFLMDAEEMSFDQTFDVILAGDVLEHVNNPGLFLARAKLALSPGGSIVIAVPSALTFAHVVNWIRRREQVHKDHVAYYSPKTIATLAERYGLLPTRLRYTVQPLSHGESRLFMLIRSIILRVLPHAAPAIIMHFSVEGFVDKSSFTILN